MIRAVNLNQQKATAMIFFEFPISERIRSLLRLEYLYKRLFHFIDCKEPFDHHAALQTLFELLETASRADIKADLLQKLEQQKLRVIQDNDRTTLVHQCDTTLQAIDAISAPLLNQLNKFGEAIRKNEWLMLLKQRFSMPGGVCQFDFPSYFLWQEKSASKRRADLKDWTASLLPVANAVVFLLQILRRTGTKQDYVAPGGSFQQVTEDQSLQLLQLFFQQELAVVPEVSANKYMLNIRFISESTCEIRPPLAKQDIPFTLISCKF